jgi:hypothetical protein
VHTNSVVQPNIDARRRFVNVPAAERDQPHRKIPESALAAVPFGDLPEPSAVIDPET